MGLSEKLNPKEVYKSSKDYVEKAKASKVGKKMWDHRGKVGVAVGVLAGAALAKKFKSRQEPS